MALQKSCLMNLIQNEHLYIQPKTHHNADLFKN